MADWTSEEPPDERSEDQYAAYTHAADHRRIARMLADAKNNLNGLLSRLLFDAKGDLLAGTGDNTAARRSVGSDGRLLIADSADPTGLKWGTVAEASGYQAPVRDRLAAGPTDWFFTDNAYGAAPPTNLNLTLDRVFYVRVVVPEDMTIDRLGVWTYGGGSGAGTVCRLGLYAPDGDGGRPKTLVVDGGTVACPVSNTLYSLTVSAAVTAGTYWAAVVRSGTGFYIACTLDTGDPNVVRPDVVASSSAVPAAGYRSDGSHTASTVFPSTIATADLSIGFTSASPVPLVRLRRAP